MERTRYEIRRPVDNLNLMILNQRLPSVLHSAGFDASMHYLPFEDDFSVLIAPTESVDGLIHAGITPEQIQETIRVGDKAAIACKLRGGVPGPLRSDRLSHQEYSRVAQDVERHGYAVTNKIGVYTVKIEPIGHTLLSSGILRDFFARYAPMSPIFNNISGQRVVLWTNPDSDHEQNRMASLGIDLELVTKIGRISAGYMILAPIEQPPGS